MASVLPDLQMRGSVPRFAADPGAQADNAGLRSMQEKLKIEQQFWMHTRAATSSQLTLYTKPNGIHQAWVLSRPPSLSSVSPALPSWWREQREVRQGTRNVCPPGFSLQVLRDLGTAITLSIGMFLENNRQAQNMVMFAQVRFSPEISLFSQGSNITLPKHQGGNDLDPSHAFLGR